MDDPLGSGAHEHGADRAALARAEHDQRRLDLVERAGEPACRRAVLERADLDVVEATPLQIFTQLFERAAFVAGVDDGDNQWGAGDVTGRDAELDRLADPGCRIERGDDRRAGVGALGLHDPTLGRARARFIA